MTKYLREKQLAAMLGVSVSKLQKDRQKRIGITPTKFNRTVLYAIDDINAYMDACKRGAHVE